MRAAGVNNPDTAPRASREPPVVQLSGTRRWTSRPITPAANTPTAASAASHIELISFSRPRLAFATRPAGQAPRGGRILPNVHRIATGHAPGKSPR